MFFFHLYFVESHSNNFPTVCVNSNNTNPILRCIQTKFLKFFACAGFWEYVYSFAYILVDKETFPYDVKGTFEGIVGQRLEDDSPIVYGVPDTIWWCSISHFGTKSNVIFFKNSNKN